MAAVLSGVVVGAADASPLPAQRVAVTPSAGVAAGDRVTVAVAVRNPSRRAVRDVRFALKLSKDARLDRRDVALRATATAARIAGRRTGRATARLVVPVGTRAGTYRVLACATPPRTRTRRRARTVCRASRPLRIGRARRPGASAPVGGTSAPAPQPQPAPAGQPSGGGAPASGGSPPASGGGPTPGPGPGPGGVVDEPTGGRTPPGALGAPGLVAGGATSFADRTSFLYSGADPVQRGVRAGAIDERRVAVLRGTVRTTDGAPLGGVQVAVLDHPELGHTTTRSDGGYDLALNGGGRPVLTFAKAGFLPIQRTVGTQWQDFVGVDDVALTPLDPAVGTVDPRDGDAFDVVRATTASDASGQRRATLLFPRGVTATMQTAAGARPLPAPWRVRATEYTVGPAGVAAMPGTLPAMTAYTYAVEFSIDEALADGASTVRFDAPVISYTENFTGAPVGGSVPVGTYDRADGRWEGNPDGGVIEVLTIDGGRASVDVDGDGQADPGAAGISEAELEVLARTYSAGQTLWRVPLSSFSPKDFNFQKRELNRRPPPPQPGQDPGDDPCVRDGSIIACESQVLGEELPVTGTGQALTYRSDRTSGWTSDRVLDVLLTSGDVSRDLRSIEVEVQVAGQIHRETVAPTPNRRYRFVWDGRDAYGRPSHGRVAAEVSVTYEYDYRVGTVFCTGSRGCWGGYVSFAGWGFNDLMTGGADGGSGEDTSRAVFPPRDCERTTRFESTCTVGFTDVYERRVGRWDAKAVAGLGGWTLSDHHSYDAGERTLHLGDGRTLAAADSGLQVETYAGRPGGVTVDFDVADDGTLVYPDTRGTYVLRRKTPDGEVRTIAGIEGGTGTDPAAGRAFDGDGGPALGAHLGEDLSAIEVAPDGSVLFAVLGPKYEGFIRRVAPDGTLSTIAGRPEDDIRAAAPEDVPIEEAELGAITAIETGPDGALYFAEQGDGGINGGRARIRMIDLRGRLQTVAGGGRDLTVDEDLGDGEPAREHRLDLPTDIAFGPDGTLYVVDTEERLVQAVGIDGNIRRFAGKGPTGTSPTNDGGSAIEAGLGSPTGVDVHPEGEVYLRSNENSYVGIRRVTADGRILRVAGVRASENPGCYGCYTETPEPAASTIIRTGALGLEVGEDGHVLFSDGAGRIRTTRDPLPGFERGDAAVPSPDGTEVYRFDRHGRHLQTLDALTGTVKRSFGYDAERRLLEIKDREGDLTRIERDASGAPVAIVAPGGQRTTLALDAQGHLASAVAPDGTRTTLQHAASGLLTGVDAPGEGQHRFTYDAEGRLTADEAPGGHVQTLTRTDTPSGWRVRLTSPEGRHTDFETERLPAGELRRRVVTGDVVTETLQDDSGEVVLREADGTTVRIDAMPDPRFGMAAPYLSRMETTTPGGRTHVVTGTRTVTLAAGDGSLRASEERIDLGTGVLRTRFTAATPASGSTPARPAEVSRTTSTGASRTVELDALGRPAVIRDGAAPVHLQRDAHGRVTSVQQGERRRVVAYDARGRVATVADGLGRQATYGYDAGDRVTSVDGPGGARVAIRRDAAGRPVAVTLPSGAVHGLDRDARGNLRGYTPPGAAAGLRLERDDDTLLERFVHPGGGAIDVLRDAQGRRRGVTYADAATTRTHKAGTSLLAEVSRLATGATEADARAFTYDGDLLTGETVTGTVAATYAHAYDAELRRVGTTLTTGEDQVALPRRLNADGVVTEVAGIELERLPDGRLGAVDDAVVRSELVYGDTGDLTGRTWRAGAQAPAAAMTLARDAEGRVTRRVLRVGTVTTTEDLAYDAQSRLIEVRRDGQAAERYGYDANGNRVSRGLGTTPAVASSFDAADRQTTQGTATVQVDADGFLRARGADRFDSSARGELLEATVGGTTVRYRYDATGRRIARTVGEATTRYLYADPDDPNQVTAVREADGTLVVLHYDAFGTLVAYDRAGVRRYVVTDQVGTPVAVLGADGAVLRRIESDAFGVVRDPGATAPELQLPIGFAGGLADPVTGLVRLGFRDYDPSSGRWTARDPLLFGGGQANLYAYVGNDPASRRDPSGLGELNGTSAAFDAGVKAVGETFTDLGKSALESRIKNAVESAGTEGTDLVENFEDGVKSKAEESLTTTPRDEYISQLEEHGEKNKPSVHRYERVVTDLWRRARRALGGCPDPPPPPPRAPEPPPKIPSYSGDY